MVAGSNWKLGQPSMDSLLMGQGTRHGNWHLHVILWVIGNVVPVWQIAYFDFIFCEIDCGYTFHSTVEVQHES